MGTEKYSLCNPLFPYEAILLSQEMEPSENVSVESHEQKIKVMGFICLYLGAWKADVWDTV